MSNTNQSSQDKNQSSSSTTPPKLRVEKVHGGTNVEEIITPVLVNEPACPHTSFSLDPTEKDFIAYVCDNPKCGLIKLFNK